jgi:hypothetical protein
MEIISQPEIDQLLASTEDDESADFLPAIVDFDSLDPKTLPGSATIAFSNLEAFESFLSERKFKPEKLYGHHSFKKEITMCRFFGSKSGEIFLADIERKNREQNMGNITIPNTKIKLINYSVCPYCKTVFSFKELMDYYKSPRPDTAYKNKGYQMGEDARVCCPDCGTYFLPALVISDGTPRNEVQFLCRMQTVDAVEKFFMERNQLVLSKNRENIFKGNGCITIRNDVPLQKMESRPTLITNILQYTPAQLLPNLIDGTNIEKGDILFGKWKPLYC